MNFSRISLGACTLLLFFGPATSGRAQADAPELFEHADGAPSGGIRLRREAIEAVQAGDALRLNLHPDGFAETAHRVRLTKATTTPLGSRVIRGRVEGQPDGSFLLVQHGAATTGSVSVSPTERYSLDGGTLRALVPQPPARCACQSDAPARRGLPRAAVARLASVPLPDATASVEEFDVLIVYTPAALHAEGGSADALTAQAELALADANACYQNSGIPIQGRIVGVRAVNYTESGEIRTDLHRLAVPDDGILDEVQGWRDETQADLVCMFTRRDSADGYKGFAEILTGLTPDAEVLGFSVVDVLAATNEHLFAHELGHNMGCDHDRENTTGLRLFDFSYGWRFTGQDRVLYRDVMAYPPGASVPYFGTPAISYAGTPTGVADYADTARTLIASAPAFVNFRAADGRGRVSVSAAVSVASVDDKGQHRAAFGFERTGSVAQGLDVVYQTGGTAVGGVNYQTLAGTLSFAAGSHFATVRLKPLPGAAPFGAETVTLALQAGDAYVVADSPTGGAVAASVTIYDRLPLVNLEPARRVGVLPSKLKVRVNRLGHTDGDLVVHYQLGGTAVAGVDYRAPAANGAVTIPAGSDNAVLVLHLLTATNPPGAGSPTIEVTLQPDAAYNVGASATADFPP